MYNKKVLTLYSSRLQPARLVPDLPRVVDPSNVHLTGTYKQLGPSSPSIWPVDQFAAIATTSDPAACDGERRLDLAIALAQTLPK